jgi:hypothetical protein
MKALDEYLRSTAAVEYFVRIVTREDGKPIVASIHPYGIAGDPLEFKVETHAEKK